MSTPDYSEYILTTEERLAALEAENDIRKLVIAFSIGMDARDREGFRSAWAPQIDLDLPMLGGRPIPRSGRRDADEYATEVIALLSQFAATQHLSTNHLISVDGGSATCVCYTHAQHHLPVDDGESWLTTGARYDLTAARLPEVGWRFVAFKLSHMWSRGNPGLWEVATARMLGAPPPG